MKDMFKMLGQVRDMQAKLKEAQDNLGSITAEAEAGGGMVKALVNGRRMVLKVEVDPDLLKPEDREMMQDLVVAAINKAMQDVEEKSKEYLQRTTQDFMPNIPGFDIGKMMGGE